ncbi:hypothetical protein EVAR_36767_1 [Eumeta japonica]|uniref:Uncharacterized protein n=1 Tax=Eumeta variegata TaxID=151549 RepID=A0A4C1X3Z1_EUMVA|nr:hypothetical protein EVAR_36767_1 [Eumeta japonica]
MSYIWNLSLAVAHRLPLICWHSKHTLAQSILQTEGRERRGRATAARRSTASPSNRKVPESILITSKESNRPLPAVVVASVTATVSAFRCNSRRTATPAVPF